MLAAQHEFNGQQLEINADVKTTLARIDMLVARMIPPSENGHEASRTSRCSPSTPGPTLHGRPATHLGPDYGTDAPCGGLCVRDGGGLAPDQYSRGRPSRQQRLDAFESASVPWNNGKPCNQTRSDGV
jgi:hypothetical protein